MNINELEEMVEDIKNKYPNCKVYIDSCEIEIWVNGKYEDTYYF